MTGNKKKPKGLDSTGAGKVIKKMSDANTRLFRATNGALGSTVGGPGGAPVCLLNTLGRKSGHIHTVPLLFLRNGDNLVIVASQGGRPRHPGWYYNIKTNPRVSVELPRHRMRMIARVASPDERERLWPKLVDLYPDFENYQQWTDRIIPVVVLEPAPDELVAAVAGSANHEPDYAPVR